MLEKLKQSKFCKKMKQIHINRAVLISVVTVLLALAVVLAITAAANRAKKKDPAQDPSTFEPSTNAPTEPESRPSQTEIEDKPTGNDNVIPTSFLVPVENGVLGKQHDASLQVFSPTMGEYRVHLGIDIGTAENAPVSAAADGIIKKIWNDPKMGTCVAIEHGGDCCTVYKNLAAELAKELKEGDKVTAGQVIAYVGSTAVTESAETPHLHLEMTVGGLSVDPMQYFKKDAFGSADQYEDEAPAGKTNQTDKKTGK